MLGLGLSRVTISSSPTSDEWDDTDLANQGLELAGPTLGLHFSFFLSALSKCVCVCVHHMCVKHSCVYFVSSCRMFYKRVTLLQVKAVITLGGTDVLSACVCVCVWTLDHTHTHTQSVSWQAGECVVFAVVYCQWRVRPCESKAPHGDEERADRGLELSAWVTAQELLSAVMFLIYDVQSCTISTFNF